MTSPAVFIFFLTGVFLCGCSSGEGPLQDDEGPIPKRISYNFHIRPILSDKCFSCHGPDANKRQAGLRLDKAEEAYGALKDNPLAHAIVPGQPEQSMVFLRISSADET